MDSATAASARLEGSLSEPSFWLRADRDEAFAALRRDQPVSWQNEPESAWSEAGRGYWAVTRYADVRAVSRAPQLFASGHGTEIFDLPIDVARRYSGMLNMDAPEHTSMRAIVNIAFSPRRIASLERTIRHRARAIVASVAERGECDFATEIADALPIAVICDLMGVPDADRGHIAQLSRASHPLGDSTFTQAYHAVETLIDYGKALLQERLRSPQDDLTAVLAAAEIDHERLDDNDAGTFFELLVTAGIETTGAAIAHGLLALTGRREQQKLWNTEFDGIAPTAIEEILRWSTPVVHFRRTATRDTELAGQRVAAGDKVVVFYNSANRDETVFAAADTFDITRSPNPHLTFGGGGPHFCLGAHLTRLEMREMFREILQALPDMAVSDEPVLLHSMFFNGVKSLRCTFTPQLPGRTPWR